MEKSKFWISFILIVSMILSMSFNINAAENILISLQIGNGNVTVNNESMPIDNDGTAPVIINGRTLVPIRAIIEAAGGSVNWNNELKEVNLDYKEK